MEQETRIGIDLLTDTVKGLTEAVKSDRRLRRVLIGAAIVVVAGFTALFIRIGIYASDTNTAVTKTIPGLEKQLADERQAREDAVFVLTKQAVPAIVAMGKQIEQLGGKPPQVILKAPDRTTTTTTGR